MSASAPEAVQDIPTVASGSDVALPGATTPPLLQVRVVRVELTPRAPKARVLPLTPHPDVRGNAPRWLASHQLCRFPANGPDLFLFRLGDQLLQVLDG